MVKESGECKDDFEKNCSNGDKESDVDVEGGKTRATGGTFWWLELIIQECWPGLLRVFY